MPTAAAIIIGNEILSGRFPDGNGPYIVKRLRELGTDLERMSVVPDKVQAIADEVAWCRGRYDHVLTTGGIGPTHDDVTLEGIARGLGTTLERRPELVEVLRRRRGREPSGAALRMTQIPRGARLLWGGEISFPVVVCQEFIVLPGVPRIFRLKFEAVSHLLVGRPRSALALRSRQRETDVADRLGRAAREFPQVSIGSYPRWDAGDYSLLITLESREAQPLQACRDLLLTLLDCDEVP